MQARTAASRPHPLPDSLPPARPPPHRCPRPQRRLRVREIVACRHAKQRQLPSHAPHPTSLLREGRPANAPSTLTKHSPPPLPPSIRITPCLPLPPPLLAACPPHP